MDDFVINVRQIGQYPTATGAQIPGGLVLLQEGLGGPYLQTNAANVVSIAMQGGGNIGLTAGYGLAWDGLAGTLSYDGSAFHFNGGAVTCDTLNSAGAMLAGGETVATQTWVGQQLTGIYSAISVQVHSFNGRNGDVTLNWEDVYTALGLNPSDPIATVSFVNQQVCDATQGFLNLSPFVFTWNGRVGDVFLTLQDVECTFFATPGLYPTAPSPPLGDASKRIATTAFVDESLEEWANEINSSWNAADFELLNILQTQYAPIHSPVFTGTPTAPMPPTISNDGTLATTAWVIARITSSVTGVVSWNGRTGTVTLTAADINGVGGALLNSPLFTGTPRVPMPAGSDNSDQIASTAWVLSELAAISAGVTSFNGRSGIVTFQASDLTAVGGAMLASPTFTGLPAAPTASPGTSSTQLATTAFVTAAVGNSVSAFNGRTGAVSLLWNDVSAVGGAPLASPSFTGIPAAPTAAPGTSTTQLATTAFVMNQLAAANVVSSFNARTGAVTFTVADLTGVGGALFSQGPAPPASPGAQSLWFDTNSGQMLVYYNNQWVAISVQ